MHDSRLGRALIVALAILWGCQDSSTPMGPDAVRPLQPSGERLRVPEDHPNGPFFSIIGISPLTGALRFPHTEEWGAAPFVRELECVPDDFNLLQLFDPRAFGCALTIEGHLVVESGVPPPQGLILSQMHGLGAVPIVFAHWNEIEAAVADGVLTLPELLALPSAVVGSAGFYKETFVNGPLQPAQLNLKLSASGTLADGRTFRLHAHESPTGGGTQITIE